MRNKNKIWFYLFTIIGLLLVFTNSCERKEDYDTPTVATSMVSNITETTATCGGNVTDDGGATVTSRGVCWSTSQNPTTSDFTTTNGSETGSFTSCLTGLTPGMDYYVRAYAINSEGAGYGEQRSFKTTTESTVVMPTVTTSTVSNITETTATCGGNVTDDGGATVTSRGVCWSTSQNPTTSDLTTTNGSGTGSFTSNLTGLTPDMDYYVRAYAINSEGAGYGEQRSFKTEPTSFEDIDGNVYHIVIIGTQIWMAENLKTTKFNNGFDIPLETDSASWAGKATYAYCWYNNNPSYKDIYGALYNWYTVSTGNLCPTGWHVPTDAEWTTLTNYLGGESVAGGKLKEADTTHWNSPNTGATNESGFTALPGSHRSDNGAFGDAGVTGRGGYWWSMTQGPGLSAWARHLSYDTGFLHQDSYNNKFGFSVRCIED